MNFEDIVITTGIVEIPGTGSGEHPNVAATGTVVVVDYTLLTGAILTVGGQAFTEGGLDEFGWDASTDNATTAHNLAAAITGHAGVTATDTTGTITITAATPGKAGNLITLATSDAVHLTISGSHLTGGD